MSEEEQSHRIRLSIDINSLRDHQFRGVVYAKYNHNPQLGIRQQFKTSPAIEVTKPVVEVQFPSSFAAYTFEATKSALVKLMQGSFDIELWHQDRMKKDNLIGVVQMSLEELLKSPIRKTAQSYVRVYDAYFPLDEVELDQDTNQRNSIKRIGSVRAIFYLEDLGPSDQLNLNEKQLMDQMFMNQQFTDQVMPGLHELPDDPEKKKLMMEMNSLEHKVIWELETWKRSEESRFKMVLKQREIDFLQRMQSEYKQKELERERSFKQALAQIQLVEGKMKQKAQELQKREQKIVQLEEDLANKLQETGRIIKQKDDESGSLIKKFKDDRLNLEKEKTTLNLKLTDSQGQINKLVDEISRLKKDMENSPIALVKGELQNKLQEISDLKKEIDKINQIKDQYKQYYERVREEFIRQKKQYEETQQSQSYTANQEIAKLRDTIDQMRIQITEAQAEIRRKNKENQELKVTLVENPFKQNALDQTEKKEVQEIQIQKKQSIQLAIPKIVAQPYPYAEKLSDLERLTRERDYLILSGEYPPTDPLIIELTRHISEITYQK